MIWFDVDCAVIVVAEVIAPVPVVVILPEVERFPVLVKFPFSSILRLVEPFDWTTKALCNAALVSLITKAADAVPALVKLKNLALELARVKSIFP